MARKKVTWTDFARQDFKETLSFYNERNQSKSYSKKLLKKIKTIIGLIVRHPNLGTATEFQEIRVIGTTPFRIYYKNKEDSLVILLIWDSRRNPEDLTEIIRAGVTN